MTKPSTPLSPSQACYDLIKSFEGLSLKAYPDPGSGADPWTIGYGSTGKDIKRGLVWTLAQAEARLKLDVASFALGVRALIVKAPTTQRQFDAMVSFAYNVGLGNLKSSTLLKKHLAGQRVDARAEFLKWDKASGRVMVGLTRRRAAEAKLYAM